MWRISDLQSLPEDPKFRYVFANNVLLSGGDPDLIIFKLGSAIDLLSVKCAVQG